MGKPLHELAAKMQMYPQVMINVRLSEGSNAAQVCKLPVVLDAVTQAESDLADTGRILLRASGTEPVIRVMVEGQDDKLVQQCCESISNVVQAQL